MDKKWFKIINGLAGRYAPADTAMIAIANKARYVYLFVFIWMWFQNKSSRKTVVHAGGCAIIAVLVNSLIKLFYDKPRPFVKRRVGILIPSKMDSSFPSKHTLLAFTVSTLVFMRKPVLGCRLWGLAVMTGFSRIWTGHHYPSDIMGSALIGSLIGMVGHTCSRFFEYSDLRWIRSTCSSVLGRMCSKPMDDRLD